jgi:ADP-ribose pyrophosphatase YjhB (NUDIX family)
LSSTGWLRSSVDFIDVFALLDEIRALARTGLHYTENPFDRARYDRLLEMASDAYAERLQVDAPELRARFLDDLGYATAKVGADAAVFDADDRLLLVRRADDGKWGLVAGWVDVNESPETTVVRELEEEAGVGARIDALVGVQFCAADETRPHGTVSIVYLCSILSGTLRPQPHEVLEIAWRDIDDLAPDEWHMHHASLARAALDAHWRRQAGL